MDKDVADKVRGMIRRVTLKNVRDDGETQRASVEVADGIWRDNVEIMPIFGLATSAPEDGAIALAVAIGGDEGDLVVLPAGNPGKRMGGLAPGEVGLHNAHGDAIVLGAGGSISIKTGADVTITVGGVTVAISASGVSVTGGEVKHNDKDIGDTHKHVGVVQGGDLTGVPS